jgi:hypothetical protein
LEHSFNPSIRRRHIQAIQLITAIQPIMAIQLSTADQLCIAIKLSVVIQLYKRSSLLRRSNPLWRSSSSSDPAICSDPARNGDPALYGDPALQAFQLLVAIQLSVASSDHTLHSVLQQATLRCPCPEIQVAAPFLPPVSGIHPPCIHSCCFVLQLHLQLHPCGFHSRSQLHSCFRQMVYAHLAYTVTASYCSSLCITSMWLWLPLQVAASLLLQANGIRTPCVYSYCIILQFHVHHEHVVVAANPGCSSTPAFGV